MKKKLLIKKIVGEFITYISPVSKQEGVRALNYHSITDGAPGNDDYQMTTPKEIFSDQMQYLRESGYTVMSCDDMVMAVKNKAALPSKTVCITFDDGFKDNFVNAALDLF